MSELFLAIGPPGTGKTRFLTRQASRAADKYTPLGVVITSMTRAAATEIASRTPGIPEDNIGTLHAHAYRALDRPDLAETPEALRDWNQAHQHLQLTGGARPLEDAPADEGGRTRGDELHSAVMNHRARQTPMSLWLPEEREYAELWNDFKAQTGRLDFTDLIERALADIPQHPASPAVFLLDEAQDFSRLELALALAWAKHTQTTVIVGDPDQTLYTWRGSDHDALQQLPVTRTQVLEQSYRVPQAVHAMAQRWVRQIEQRRDVTYHPTSDPGAARRMPISLRNPAPLAAAITEDLDAGRTAMVLTTCGYMLAPVLQTLRRAGIPFHNPYRTTDGRWNPLRGAGALLAFLRPLESVWGNQARLWTWDDLRLWTDPLQAKGVLQRGAKSLIESKCKPDSFGESQADDEVRTETLCSQILLPYPPLPAGVHLSEDELAARQITNHPLFSFDVDWWQGRLLASKVKTSTYPLEVYRTRGGSALREKPRVIVGTIHSVKGGEADSVYVFPDLSKQGYWHGWHHAGPRRDQIVRMFYVALTRARHQVTVLEPASSEHVPMELLEPLPAMEAIAA